MAAQPARKPGKLTYSDYLEWPGEERWEIIDGQAWAMSPSPGESHQRTVVTLSARLEAHFEGRPCRVYVAPFDVVLTEHDVVQPDLLVVCDKAKIRATHVAGAPDLVVEILSPSTAPRDLHEKLDLYERHRVPEYLVVHPSDKYVERFVLDEGGRYGRAAIFVAGEAYKSAVFEGLEIDLARVFPD